MNTTKRLSSAFAILITSALLLGCTPEQLSTYKSLTGAQLSASDEAVMLALPDQTMKLADGSVIEVDGSVTPPTACDVEKGRINALTYTYTVSGPAMEAYAAVARCRGWSQAQIDSWRIALSDIMRFESGYCYNVLGGARMASGSGCGISRQGSRGDAGFGQLISLHYRHTSAGTGWLCSQEGLCSKWDIVATPWNSMSALLALVERSSTQGWCYSSSARRLHRTTCNNPGLEV